MAAGTGRIYHFNPDCRDARTVWPVRALLLSGLGQLLAVVQVLIVPLVQVEGDVQLVQPYGFCLQLVLLREGAVDLLLGGGKLLFGVLQLLTGGVALGFDARKGIVQTGDVAVEVCPERDRVREMLLVALPRTDNVAAVEKS